MIPWSPAPMSSNALVPMSWTPWSISGDIARNRTKNFTRVTVQAVFFGVEADVLADLSHDRFVVNLGGGGDFTENHDHVRLGRRFAATRSGSWAKISQDAVGNLIGEFVRVALVDGFGREEKVFNLWDIILYYVISVYCSFNNNNSNTISQYIILKSHHTHPKLTALNESYESV